MSGPATWDALKDSLAFLWELCFPDLCMDKTCLCSALQQNGKDNAARLSPAVSSLLVIPLCYTSSSSEILLLCQTQTSRCGLGLAVLLKQLLYPHGDTSLLFCRPQRTLPACILLGVLVWERIFWRELRGSRLAWEHGSSPDLVTSLEWENVGLSAISGMQTRCWRPHWDFPSTSEACCPTPV